MNWLLIVILVVFLLLLIHGWRKGFLRILFSLAAILVLIGLVSFATPHISGFLKEHTGIYTMLEERCAERIQTRAEGEAETEDSGDAPSESSVAGISLPQKAVAYLTDGGDAAESGSVYQTLGGRAADLILSGASFLIALILAIIIVKLIDAGLGLVNHIPVLSGINRALGLFAGIFEGFLLVSIFFLFVALIAGTDLGKLLTGYIDESKFLSFIYQKNIILKFFSIR